MIPQRALLKAVLWGATGLAAGVAVVLIAHARVGTTDWADASPSILRVAFFLFGGGTVAAAALAFLWLDERSARRSHEASDATRIRDDRFAARRVGSLAFTLSLAVGLSAVPWQPLVRASPVSRATGDDLLRFPGGTVEFPHTAHVERIGECGICHHATKGDDPGTPCTDCHADRERATRVFDHARHVTAAGGNASCVHCHTAGLPHSMPVSQECRACHPGGADVSPWAPRYASPTAPGLRPAAHGLCIGCHEREAARPGAPRTDLARCATCHRAAVPEHDAAADPPASRDVTRE
jgi:hypothetical protein